MLYVYGAPSVSPKYGYIGEVLFFIIVLLVYFALGYLLSGKVLKNQNNHLKNIISVNLIFILGILVWAYKFIADIWWVFGYFFYNYYSILLYPISAIFHYDDPFKLVDWQILFSLLPVLLIWGGMELKYWERNRQNKAKNNLEIQS